MAKGALRSLAIHSDFGLPDRVMPAIALQSSIPRLLDRQIRCGQITLSLLTRRSTDRSLFGKL
jgi:hypothetical protein